jgi:hypothetical protein
MLTPGSRLLGRLRTSQIVGDRGRTAGGCPLRRGGRSTKHDGRARTHASPAAASLLSQATRLNSSGLPQSTRCLRPHQPPQHPPQGGAGKSTPATDDDHDSTDRRIASLRRSTRAAFAVSADDVLAAGARSCSRCSQPGARRRHRSRAGAPTPLVRDRNARPAGDRC